MVDTSYHSPWHFSISRQLPPITVGERERTRALRGEILCLSTSSTTSTSSTGASVGSTLLASPFHPLRGSSLIAVGESEHTHALHDEILYPSTSAEASAPSAGESVGAPQVTPMLVH